MKCLQFTVLLFRCGSYVSAGAFFEGTPAEMDLIIEKCPRESCSFEGLYSSKNNISMVHFLLQAPVNRLHQSCTNLQLIQYLNLVVHIFLAFCPALHSSARRPLLPMLHRVCNIWSRVVIVSLSVVSYVTCTIIFHQQDSQKAVEPVLVTMLSWLSEFLSEAQRVRW